MHKVNGQKDPIIKLLRDLVGEDGRRRLGRFFVEGEEMIRRAFDYSGKVDSVIMTDKFSSSADAQETIERASSSNIGIFIATEGLLSKTLDAKPTPECIAIVERRVAQLSDILSSKHPLLLMVEHGENADNLGMLLRSTDAAGVDGVILAADTADPFSRRVVRGSRGAVFTVPICIRQDIVKVIEEAKKNGLQIIASSAQSDVIYTQIDYTKPTLVIIGNEHVGISDAVRARSDVVVRIPMRGRINSLNIAVAASVLLYEVSRQR